MSLSVPARVSKKLGTPFSPFRVPVYAIRAGPSVVHAVSLVRLAE
jgi:hypothetical protein